MKRIALAISLLLVISILLIGLAKANPFTPNKDYPDTPDKNPPSIALQLPKNNKIYSSGIVPYSISIQEPSFWFNSSAHGEIAFVRYIIDEKETNTIFGIDDGWNYDPILNLNGTFWANDGNHSITIFVRCARFYYNPIVPKSGFGWWDTPPLIYNLDTYSNRIYFTVNSSLPSISSLTLENTTYNTNEIPLNFTLNEPFSQIRYNLDGNGNITITQNTTLTGLSNGIHTITIYPKDAAENVGPSETIDFRIELPFPTNSVLAGVMIVFVIAISIRVYVKKRKRQAKPISLQ